jgi:hypothetical protein
MLKTNEEKLTLLNLGGGAAAEKFDRELERVLLNIMDANTPPDKEREVVLKVKIKPNDGRNQIAINITCDSKIAGNWAFKTAALIGRDRGRAVAQELVHMQQQLFDNVAEFKKKEEGQND